MLEEMKTFALWWFEQLPDFLMSEPICYFVGFALLLFAIAAFSQLIHIHD